MVHHCLFRWEKVELGQSRRHQVILAWTQNQTKIIIEASEWRRGDECLKCFQPEKIRKVRLFEGELKLGKVHENVRRELVTFRGKNARKYIDVSARWSADSSWRSYYKQTRAITSILCLGQCEARIRIQPRMCGRCCRAPFINSEGNLTQFLSSERAWICSG